MDGDYPQASEDMPGIGMMGGAISPRARHIPMRVQLVEERQHHQHEVERITQLLDLLEKNPAIEQFINLQRGYKL